MDKNKQSNFQEIKMEVIVKQLREIKQLEVTNSKMSKIGFGDIIFAENLTEQYTIKIISLSKDDSDLICPIKLMEARQCAFNLASCSHQNILTFKDEFQIEDNYFILMEKCEISLQNWVEKNNFNKIDRDVFINLCLGILKAIEYLHSNHYLARQISLNNILLDKDMNVKLYNFGYTNEIDTLKATQEFLSQKVNKSLFYLPPEEIDLQPNLNKSYKRYQTFEGDIWQVGIALYALAGAEFIHLKKLTKGQQFYLYQQRIDSDINKIIMNILSVNPYGRPTISNIIQQFENIKIEEAKPYSEEFIELFNQGKECFNNEEFKDAIDYFKQALELNPQSDKAMNCIGECYSELSNYDEAIIYYQKTIQINPKFAKAYNSLGKALFEKDQIDDAINIFNQALVIQPQNSFAYNYLGNSYKDKNMYEEAIANFTKAYEVNNHFYFAYFNLGLTYYEQSMYNDAIYWLNKVIPYQPFNTEVLYFLGASHGGKQELSEAEVYYKKALEINPNDLRILNVLGFTYTFQSKQQEALSTFKRAIEIDKKRPGPYHGLGNLYFNHELQDYSIYWYKKAIKMCPFDEHVIYNLGITQSKKEKLEKAINCLQKAVKLSEENEHDHDYIDQLVEVKKKI